MCPDPGREGKNFADDVVLGRMVRGRLAEEGADRLAQRDRRIDLAIGAGAYAPTAIRSSWAWYAASARSTTSAASSNSGETTASRTRLTLSQHVDRREVLRVRELAREHDVSVEDRTGRVGHRLVEVVALDEHGVEAGDAARSAPFRRARAGAGSGREDRRRIALRGRAARRRPGRSRATPWRRA